MQPLLPKMNVWNSEKCVTFATPECKSITARVAKLVDALCSGRSVRKDVLVRIQSRAQSPLFGGFSYALKYRITNTFMLLLFFNFLLFDFLLSPYCPRDLFCWLDLDTFIQPKENKGKYKRYECNFKKESKQR